MIEIPYNVKPREETGLFNAKLGIWLFLASEVMLFGGLFSAFVLLRVGTFNLILSSWTIVKSWVALKENDIKGFKMFMGITLLCSILFLII